MRGQQLFQPFLLPHPKLLGSQNRQSPGKPSNDHNKQIIEGGGRPNAGQSRFPFHISHNKRVHPVENLLKHTAEDQWDCKEYQRLSNTPPYHVPFHFIPSNRTQESIQELPYSKIRRTTGVTHERLSNLQY